MSDLDSTVTSPVRVPLRPDGGPVRVAIAGASGLVGTALAASLERDGHQVLRMVRGRAPGTGELAWDPQEGRLDPAAIAGLDAVVNLAGENVSSGRWNHEVKERIRDSRVRGSRTIALAIAGANPKPSVWINASAIGFYGDRGGEPLDESSEPGTGFLAELCREWEAATEPAIVAGARVVRLRVGIVLSSEGGALGRMLTPFRLGLGGRIGDGRNMMSWITLDDLVRAIRFAISRPDIDGVLNGVAPTPVSNREFVAALGSALRRPALLPIPAAVLRAVFGEFADEGLLAGAYVIPRRLEQFGFRFEHPEIGAALRAVLGSP